MNQAEIFTEIIYHTEKITGKKTKSSGSTLDQTGTVGPTWLKATRRWICTGMREEKSERESGESC